MKSERLFCSLEPNLNSIERYESLVLRRRENHANRILEQEVMNKLVKSARNVKNEHSIHFKGMITLLKMLQKSGEQYIRNQRVSFPPLKKIRVKS